MNVTRCLARCLAVAALLSPAAVSAQAQQGMTIGMAAGIQRAWNAIKLNVTESAANMPEAISMSRFSINRRTSTLLAFVGV